jgi:hypothetical protein
LVANITSGTVTPRTVGVKEPVYDVYVANGGYTGRIGLPLGAELKQPNGHYRQAFEGGTIDYDPANPSSATLLLPVKSVIIAPQPVGGTLKMNQGDTATVSANAYASDGSTLTGRFFNWSTTNGRIVSISQASGNTATLNAVGGGAASITVTSEGMTSSVLNVFVTARVAL